MMITPGEFWVAEITFTDSFTTKKRPVLILWLDGEDVVVAAVTSARPRTITDIALKDWQQSGLRVASTVRLSRLDCLEQSLMIAEIGSITEEDVQAIKTIWQLHIKPQF